MVRPKEAAAPILDGPETSFLSAEDEMVARVPIIEGGMRNVTFKIDTMKAWGVISVTTRELDCCTYVKSAQRTRDLRKAYSDL